jgi:molybdopterin-containing oxidoreductase family iron-sulfur binding subunit
MNGKEAEWSAVDKEVKSKLEAIAQRGGNIRILTSTIISPSIKAAVAEFTASYPTTQVVTYDAVSLKAIADAHLASHGKAMIPTYQFDKADFVLGIGCDFLTNWLSPVEYARLYASK